MTTLLSLDDLEIEFAARGRTTNRPVRGISLDVDAGEVLGVVGETGCGKTLTALAILGMLPRGAVARGRISLDGEDQPLNTPSPVRGSVASIVFQNPGTAFNPVFTIGDQMGHVLARHMKLRGRAARERMLHYLGLVQLPDPERVAASYPHQLSGGMLQRAMIALALLCEPRLLILDEPTTALDVTVAKQILELVRRLRDELGLAVLLVTHNLGVVQETCDRIAVLYAGRVVETGTTAQVLDSPRHPYTIGLLGALPARHEHGQPLEAIRGAVPSNLLAIEGCAFVDRCPIAVEACRTTDPPLDSVGDAHGVACIRAEVPR